MFFIQVQMVMKKLIKILSVNIKNGNMFDHLNYITILLYIIDAELEKKIFDTA